MSDQPTIGGWLIGGGGLVALGAGIRWAGEKWAAWRVSREAKIEAREDEYVKKLEARIEDLETEFRKQAREVEAHRLAIAVLVADVARRDPHAMVLRQVSDILGSAFPLHIITPDDMTAQLNRMP